MSKDTVTYWENGTDCTMVKHYPQIITFLAYFLFKIGMSAFGNRITWYRYKMALSWNAFGTILKMDGSTVWSYEPGEHMPGKNMQSPLLLLCIVLRVYLWLKTFNFTFLYYSASSLYKIPLA